MDLYATCPPLLTYFRRKRMQRFSQLFAVEGDMSILDVGGTPFNWLLLPSPPHQVSILNLPEEVQDLCVPASGRTSFRFMAGDARSLQHPDQSIDIVYSNSVIEHVGDFEQQRRMASEIRRVGRSYFVQTPNRGFFLELHYATPFIHFVPPRYRRLLLRNFTVWGWYTRPSASRCAKSVQDLHLLDKDEMRALFPDAIIEEEKFMGMTKSLIAIKRSTEAIHRAQTHRAQKATAPMLMVGREGAIRLAPAGLPRSDSPAWRAARETFPSASDIPLEKLSQPPSGRRPARDYFDCA